MEIFLIGMMGVGKSYWSHLLAPKLNCDVYDLDSIIVEIAGKSVADIFAQEGEAHFRALETQVLHTFSGKKNFILATGGGAPCFNNNMEWMNAHGQTIWIDESVEVLAERLAPEKSHRPLLSQLSDDELHQYLNHKIAERIPFYGKAQFRIGPNINETHFDFLKS